LQQLGRQVGRPITPDEARARGLDRQLLGQLIAEAALDEQAKKLQLGLANDDIAQRITADPSFRGPNGQFDRAHSNSSSAKLALLKAVSSRISDARSCAGKSPKVSPVI